MKSTLIKDTTKSERIQLIKEMKKYNISLKKNNQLIMSFITYDRKFERKILKAMQKLKCYCNIEEVSK